MTDKHQSYLKLLEEKCRCTINVFDSNPFLPRKEWRSRWPLKRKAAFLWERMQRYNTTAGYSLEYIEQLLKEEAK